MRALAAEVCANTSVCVALIWSVTRRVCAWCMGIGVTMRQDVEVAKSLPIIFMGN